MIIFPAIDLRGGKAVRLTQGDYNRMEVFSEDPVNVARDFYARGARFLHVVDLDGAKDGNLSNFETVERIIGAVDMFVQIGGGIRDPERAQRCLGAGAGRIILGTAAIKDPEFLTFAVKKWGDKIAVGVDAKDGMAATEGWLSVSETDGAEFCGLLKQKGVKTVIYTDISRDGAMRGTNLDIYRRLSQIKGINFIASGGICLVCEILALREMGIYGAIVGKAVYTGALNLESALDAAK